MLTVKRCAKQKSNFLQNVLKMIFFILQLFFSHLRDTCVPLPKTNFQMRSTKAMRVGVRCGWGCGVGGAIMPGYGDEVGPLLAPAILPWYGMLCYGMVWYVMLCYGMVWYGIVWYDVVCFEGV